MIPVVVFKVGGSLLDWPLLPVRFTSCLATWVGLRRVVIAGGGRSVDWVRDLDRMHGLGEERAHHLALRALDLTAHFLAALVEELRVVDSPADFEAVWNVGLVPLLAPRRFLDEDDRTSDDPLPHAWTVTSDSIAARVAARLGARELVLLKSAPLAPGIDRQEAARLGLVDPAFPAAARGLGRVTYINLRGDTNLALPLA